MPMQSDLELSNIARAKMLTYLSLAAVMSAAIAET